MGPLGIKSTVNLNCATNSPARQSGHYHTAAPARLAHQLSRQTFPSRSFHPCAISTLSLLKTIPHELLKPTPARTKQFLRDHPPSLLWKQTSAPQPSISPPVQEITPQKISSHHWNDSKTRSRSQRVSWRINPRALEGHL